MRMEAHLSHRQEMRMKLAPQIIQSIEILQLPILELREMIKHELEENPTLEVDEEQDETEEDKALEQPVGIGAAEDPEAPKDRMTETLEALDRQREDDWSLRPKGTSGEDGADRKMEALMNTPARGSSLQGYLMDQWHAMDIPEKIKRIGAYLIENIDDNGYLTHPFESLTDGQGRVVEEGLREAVNRTIRQEAEQFVDSMRKLDPETFGGKTVRRQVLRSLDAEDENRELKIALLNSMDDSLNQKVPLEEALAPILASEHDMYAALGRVQGLDPRGVGARNTQECLLLQLDRDDDEYDFKKILLEKHLEDIRLNKLPKIAREAGKDIEDVKAIVGQLTKMNPKPGASYSNEDVPTVMPDVIVEAVESEYMIKLQNGLIPRLCISGTYRDMLTDKKTTAVEKEFIRNKVEIAKRLISSIEQREHTLFRIATELVKVQRAFLDHGVSHLHPLRMQEIADTLSLHVSTISRAINDKYIQTPRGIYALKYFFSGATEAADGEDKSRVSVQSRIKELVQGENTGTPLSDGDIVDKLKAEGLTIARRTVTKYRKALKIPSSRQRKIF